MLNENVEQVVGGSILENFGEPLAERFVNLDGTDLLLNGVLVVRVVGRLGSRLKRETAALLSGSGDKDFVTGQVTCGSVMAGVRDSPRVVRHEESRVEDPADSIVERLASAEALVTTLVSNDPYAGEDHTLEDPVSGPGSKTSSSLLNAKGNVGRKGVGLEAREGASDGRVNKASGIAKCSNHGKIGKHIGERLEGGALKAVSRDRREKILDGELGHVKGGDVLLVVGGSLAMRVTDGLSLAGLGGGGGSSGLLACALTGSGNVGCDSGRHVDGSLKPS